MTHVRTLAPASTADPIGAAIARHRTAYDAYQIAPEGEASVFASDDYDAATDALVTTPCASRFAASASTSGEYAEIRARLLAAYAEDRAARPVSGKAASWSIEDEASILVFQQCDRICAEILALPMLQTRDGLGLLAMAAAMTWEASDPHDDQDRAALAIIRAMLALTETTMPPGFVGFGDEPEIKARDAALYAGTGSLPAWAIAEAEAGDVADAPSPTVSPIA